MWANVNGWTRVRVWVNKYEWTERKCDKLFNAVKYLFIAVFDSLLPIKAALHYGGVYKNQILKYGKYG